MHLFYWTNTNNIIQLIQSSIFFLPLIFPLLHDNFWASEVDCHPHSFQLLPEGEKADPKVPTDEGPDDQAEDLIPAQGQHQQVDPIPNQNHRDQDQDRKHKTWLGLEDSNEQADSSQEMENATDKLNHMIQLDHSTHSNFADCYCEDNMAKY